jgi:hypothetical protein
LQTGRASAQGGKIYGYFRFSCLTREKTRAIHSRHTSLTARGCPASSYAGCGNPKQ